MPPGWPGFHDAAIYPLGGPDLVTARRLAGNGRRHGVLYTCNTSGWCVEQAQIVRKNLAAIGIDLEIREFKSFGDMFAALETPHEPFDVSVEGWIGDFPDPSQFADALFSNYPTTRFVYRSPLGPRIRAAQRLTGAQRNDAYATLDRDLTTGEAPFIPTENEVRMDFFSARIGCQVEDPVYGIDLGALCVRG
jgi:ABC-type oligopeptide transport system substrate-binding subunit